MTHLISIETLEATINRVRVERPAVAGRLSPELRVLAEIYGTMIYAKAREVDLDQLGENLRPMAVQLIVGASANSAG